MRLGIRRAESRGKKCDVRLKNINAPTGNNASPIMTLLLRKMPTSAKAQTAKKREQWSRYYLSAEYQPT
jgi:hypothetical protein